METVYLVSLLVGGFFVLLSMFGGDSDADADVEFDVDTDFDTDFEVDFDADLDADFDGDVHIGGGGDISAGPGFIDLFSLRALFLFAAFFGLTGSALTWIDMNSALTAIFAISIGLIAGLGGNYIIKKYGYAEVSSDVTTHELKGKTGKVLLPFSGNEKGKIRLVVKGMEVRLIAQSLDDASSEVFQQGDEIVVVRTENGIAEVVKPT